MTELQTPINPGTDPITGSRIDPVCGMSVKPARKNLVALYDGEVIGSAPTPASAPSSQTLKNIWSASRLNGKAFSGGTWRGWQERTRESLAPARPSATDSGGTEVRKIGPFFGFASTLRLGSHLEPQED